MNTVTSIYTYDGGVICPFNPIPDQIVIEDVARGLGNTCRWGGQCREFYSVAEHSLMVACQCSDEFRLWGLLHDSAEAYIGDVLPPLKDQVWYHVPDERGVIQRIPYREVEHRILQLVLEKMAPTLVKTRPDVVTESDMIVRRWEFRELCDRLTRENSTFVPMSAREAREKWLEAYLRLAALEMDNGQLTMDNGEPAMPSAVSDGLREPAA